MGARGDENDERVPRKEALSGEEDIDSMKIQLKHSRPRVILAL